MWKIVEYICAACDNPLTVWTASIWINQLIHDCDVYKAGNGHEFQVSRSGIEVGKWP